jgi:hypothetical protein
MKGQKDLPRIVCQHCWTIQIDRGQYKCTSCNIPLVRKKNDLSDLVEDEMRILKTKGGNDDQGQTRR